MTEEKTAPPRKKTAGAHGRPLPHLRAWRDAKLINSGDLAAQAGVSRANISRIELGGNASYTTVKSIAEALGISTDELIYVNPSEKRKGK